MRMVTVRSHARAWLPAATHTTPFSAAVPGALLHLSGKEVTREERGERERVRGLAD